MITASLLGVRNILKRYTGATCRYIDRACMVKSMSTDTEAKNDKPIPFLSSPAARISVAQTNRISSDVLWYQPYVVSLSIAVFLLYFCVFREENDVDRLLERSLTETIPAMEKKQLLQAYDYNKQNGIDVSAIEQRLKEIILEEKKATAAN